MHFVVFLIFAWTERPGRLARLVIAMFAQLVDNELDDLADYKNTLQAVWDTWPPYFTIFSAS